MKWKVFYKSIIFCLILGNVGHAQSDDSYFFKVDLTKVKKDQLTIELVPPKMQGHSVIYKMPRIVPGTYKIYDFGRFVSDFEVRDQQGKLMSVERLDDNSWKIKKPSKIARILYTVEDTWDTSLKEKIVFEPAGTSFEKGENFVLNAQGLFGYFEGKEEMDYKVQILKPKYMIGATALVDQDDSKESDIFQVESYGRLVDSPMMFAASDTTTLNIGGAEILVSVYSPNHVLDADIIADNIYEVLDAQRKYLGGKLPIDRYAFIFYLANKPTLSGSMGALEHWYSSFYLLPEMAGEYLAQTIRDITAHEFFHIVTPLGIHAEEIQHFNFGEPVMSRHLWMYEGVTEYFSTHVQVKYGLMSVDKYFKALKAKIEVSQEWYQDSLSFTEMSLGCLDEHISQYGNVYEKGALLGLGLDITLMEASDGTYTLRNLMLDLSEKYGADKSFKDEALFGIIEEVSGYSEARVYLETHVAKGVPLDYSALFDKVGVLYEERKEYFDFTLGNVGVDINENNQVYVTDISDLDPFGRSLGYREGDILLTFKGEAIDGDNAMNLITSYKEEAKVGEELVIIVLRNDKEKVLKAKMKPIKKVQRGVFQLMENPTEKQLKLRMVWLGKGDEGFSSGD